MRRVLLLDFDVIDNWHSDLDGMNEGKKELLAEISGSFVQLLGYMRVYFHLPYRQAYGVVVRHFFYIFWSFG